MGTASKVSLLLFLCGLVNLSSAAIDLTKSIYYEGPCGEWAPVQLGVTLNPETAYFVVLANHIHWEAMSFLFVSTTQTLTDIQITHVHHSEAVHNNTVTHIVEYYDEARAATATATQVQPYFYNWTSTILSTGVQPFNYASKLVWTNEELTQQLYQECVYLAPGLTLKKWKVLSLEMPSTQDTYFILNEIEQLGFKRDFVFDLRNVPNANFDFPRIPRSYADQALQATLLLNGTLDTSPIYANQPIYYNEVRFESLAHLYKDFTSPLRQGVVDAIQLCANCGGGAKPKYCELWQ